MKKCTPIVFYNSVNFALHELHVITATGENIQIVAYDEDNIKHPYIQESRQHLTKSIINLCKQNGFYVPHIKGLGGKMYNIVWININNPTFKYRYLTKEWKEKTTW